MHSTYASKSYYILHKLVVLLKVLVYSITFNLTYNLLKFFEGFHTKTKMKHTGILLTFVTFLLLYTIALFVEVPLIFLRLLLYFTFLLKVKTNLPLLDVVSFDAFNFYIGVSAKKINFYGDLIYFNPLNKKGEGAKTFNIFRFLQTVFDYQFNTFNTSYYSKFPHLITPVHCLKLRAPSIKLESGFQAYGP